MKPTLTGFMIGLVLVSMFAGVFSFFMSDLSVTYGVANNNTLDKYNKMNELYNQSQAIKNSTTSISQPTSTLDIVGGFFYNAYLVLVSIPKSFDLFQSMTEDATIEADSGLGGGWVLIKNALITIVILLIFLGVILSVLIKSDVL